MTPTFHAPRALRRTSTLVSALASAMTLSAVLVSESHCGSGSIDGISTSNETTRGQVAPLRFTYDNVSQRIRAEVTVPVEANTSIVVRLRKGTLKVDGLNALSCSEIAQQGKAIATSSPLFDGSDGGPVVYEGPQIVDSTYFDQFYERESIGPDATADQLTAIQAGTDPILEGCILRGNTVVAKAQGSLFRAWDDATPDLVHKVQAYENGGSKAAYMHSVSSYGALCEAELGEIPFFPKHADGTYDTYDCTKGPLSVTVPITVTDASGNAVVQTEQQAKCDKPDWLRGSCHPYVRVQRSTNSQGSHFVLLCRKPPVGQKATDTTFNDIALIGHNPKTGKACYFQNGLYGKTDAAHVTNPADQQLAESTWSSFNASTCNTCHDNDAWNHTPWIDQAKYPDGSYVVPRIGSDPDYPMGTKIPFALVAMRSKGWVMPKQLVGPGVAACTQCHRIATGNTMTGEQTTASWAFRATGQDTAFNQTRVSDAFLSFANSHWMPPTSAGVTESSWTGSAFDLAVKYIDGCNQKGATCATQDTPGAAP